MEIIKSYPTLITALGAIISVLLTFLITKRKYSLELNKFSLEIKKLKLEINKLDKDNNSTTENERIESIKIHEEIASYGIELFNTGYGRNIDFENVSIEAKHRIMFFGVAMTYMSRYAKKRLADLAQNVNIDILMLDPEFVESNPEYSKSLEEFLDRTGSSFSNSVREAFNILKSFGEEWNGNPQNKTKIRLRVWNTIPSVSIVLIDPDNDNSKFAIEFFLYHSGERRPRLICKKSENKESMYKIVVDRYIPLWEKSKIIVN